MCDYVYTYIHTYIYIYIYHCIHCCILVLTLDSILPIVSYVVCFHPFATICC